MPGYGRIDNDLGEFRAYVKSTARMMKEDPSFDGAKRIESAFEALAKGSDLKIEGDKIIHGTQLGEKEAKALYKLTKKFIETHDVVTVSDSMLANMNAVKDKFGFELGGKFRTLENQIVEKAEIVYPSGKSDLQAQLEKELKDHAKEVNNLKKAFRSKLIKYSACAAGGFVGVIVGMGLAVATAGIGLIVLGAGIAVLGVSALLFGIFKLPTGDNEYRNQVALQSARLKAFEVLNDEEKFKSFCMWHQLDPQNVTINELMYAYQFSIRREDRPKVSDQFEELNSSYHHMLVPDDYYKDSNDTRDGFMKKFQGCGLKEDEQKLHVVRYLDHSLKMDSFPDGRTLLYFPPEEKYWRHQRLLEVQKELQPDTQGLSKKEELELLRLTEPRNRWQEYRLKTLQEEEGMFDAYKKRIEEYANSDEFKVQRLKDRREMNVNAESYKEYACLLMERYPFAGSYHLARLNELRNELKLA